MKLSKEEAKEQTSCAPDQDAPRYPYGLSINLDDDSLEKLGIGNDVNVGDEVQIVASATVQSKSGYQTMMGDAENSLTLQITDMAVVSSGSSKTIKALYDSKS